MEAVIRELLEGNVQQVRWRLLRDELKKSNIQVVLINGMELKITNRFSRDRNEIGAFVKTISSACFLLSTGPEYRALCYIPESTPYETRIKYAEAQLRITRAFEIPYLVQEELCLSHEEIYDALLLPRLPGPEASTDEELFLRGVKEQEIYPLKSMALPPTRLLNVSDIYYQYLRRFIADRIPIAVKIVLKKDFSLLEGEPVIVKSYSNDYLTPSGLASRVLTVEPEPRYFLLFFKNTLVFVVWCPAVAEEEAPADFKDTYARMNYCILQKTTVLTIQRTLPEYPLITIEAHSPGDVTDAIVTDMLEKEKRADKRPFIPVPPDRPQAACHTAQAGGDYGPPPWCETFS